LVSIPSSSSFSSFFDDLLFLFLFGLTLHLFLFLGYFSSLPLLYPLKYFIPSGSLQPPSPPSFFRRFEAGNASLCDNCDYRSVPIYRSSFVLRESFLPRSNESVSTCSRHGHDFAKRKKTSFPPERHTGSPGSSVSNEMVASFRVIAFLNSFSLSAHVAVMRLIFSFSPLGIHGVPILLFFPPPVPDAEQLLLLSLTDFVFRAAPLYPPRFSESVCRPFSHRFQRCLVQFPRSPFNFLGFTLFFTLEVGNSLFFFFCSPHPPPPLNLSPHGYMTPPLEIGCFFVHGNSKSSFPYLIAVCLRSW